MITHIEDATGVSLYDNDVESVFSVKDEISPNTMCALQLSYDSNDDRYGGLFNMHPFPAGQPIPIAKMHVIPRKYSQPIKVAAFFDTGASYTIINSDILPPNYGSKKKQYFHVVNNQVLRTELISKSIKLQFFPGCSVVHRVIGSKLPRKDLIMGFDLYTKKKGL
uniref:Retropepsins domain-containing protein n=1 Tax=Cannabis sativa TaxID=3483 RepID=A0A803PTZ1_CANSA